MGIDMSGNEGFREVEDRFPEPEVDEFSDEAIDAPGVTADENEGDDLPDDFGTNTDQEPPVGSPWTSPPGEIPAAHSPSRQDKPRPQAADAPSAVQPPEPDAEPVRRIRYEGPATATATGVGRQPGADAETESVPPPPAAAQEERNGDRRQPDRPRPQPADAPRVVRATATVQAQPERSEAQTSVDAVAAARRRPGAQDRPRPSERAGERGQAATTEVLPEEKIPTEHNHMSALLKAAIHNGGEIPADYDMAPDDRAVVQAAAQIVLDNMARLVPGGRSDINIIRAMPPDSEIIASMQKGITLPTVIVAQRALELRAEDPRARMARAAAHKLLPGVVDEALTEGTSQLERIAEQMAKKIFKEQFTGQKHEKLAPFVAAYAVEMAGRSHRDDPELVAATLLGFSHSCDVAQLNLRGLPPQLNSLNARTKSMVNQVGQQVRAEFGNVPVRGRSAAKVAEQIDSRVHSLITVNLHALAGGYIEARDAQHHAAVEAAEAAKRAAAEKAAREAEIPVQNAQSSYDYNIVASASPEELVPNIATALNHGDWVGLTQRVAALMEHSAMGEPVAEEALGNIWNTVTPAIVDYAFSIRRRLMEGEVPPDVALVIDQLDPANMVEGPTRERALKLQTILNIRAAAHYHPEGRTSIRRRVNTGGSEEEVEVWTYSAFPPEERHILRAGFVRDRLRARANDAIRDYQADGQDVRARQVAVHNGGRLAYLMQAAGNVDIESRQATLPIRLRKQISEARTYVADLQAQEQRYRGVRGLINRAVDAAADGLRNHQNGWRRRGYNT